MIRNLSWRADGVSKQALREAGAVGGLMRAALTATKEATLKVILSAVWNLSAHCSVNKVRPALFWLFLLCECLKFVES